MLNHLLKKIDKKILSGSWQRYLNKKSNTKIINLASGEFDYQYTSLYLKNNSNPLALLCGKYGSDKGSNFSFGHPYSWPPHTYVDYYHLIFHSHRKCIKKVFECGLGTNNPNLLSSMGLNGKPGASLRVWRDYFPNAVIYGADIDRDILFSEERILTFYIDQLNPAAIKDFWSKVNLNDFDIIIDDGLHTFEAGSTLFFHSINMLSVDGIYIIEDVAVDDLFKYKTFFNNFDFDVNYVLMSRPNLSFGDNILIVVRKRSSSLT